MAAAARSVGIPIRIAGCSQSIQGDDHHWTEFYDTMISSNCTHAHALTILTVLLPGHTGPVIVLVFALTLA